MTRLDEVRQFWFENACVSPARGAVCEKGVGWKGVGRGGAVLAAVGLAPGAHVGVGVVCRR